MAYRLTLFFLLFSLCISAQQLSRSEYIIKYNNLATNQMLSNGIPASIILAQALLESRNGNSELALKSNNHFGIKCHASWEGDRVFHDDDKKQECFRKYKRVKDSYLDHSNFLKKQRYQFLYDIPVNNYKAWAKGLKKAGYATNPKYASLLIQIIEDNNLTIYDRPTKNEKHSKYFVSGFTYGWPYLLSQQFLYFNTKKEFLINGIVSASLENITSQIGVNKLFTKNISIGLNFGVTLSMNEKVYSIDPVFGPNSKFIFETKNKKVVIDIMLHSNTSFELTPSISFGLLK
jgi:hypothetical protein